MKWTALLFGLALYLFAGSAYSANVAVYFDESATCSSAQAPPNVPFPAYLIFTEMSSSSLKAWEIHLEFGDITLISLRARNEHIMVSPWPGDYMCGLGSPQPVSNGTYIAADLTIMATTATRPSYIAGGGVHFHFLPTSVPCYLDAEGGAHELKIEWWDTYLAAVNEFYACIVADDVSSFGTVKSLFR